MRVTITRFTLVVVALLLAASTAAAQAPTYFPFGTVNVGTASSGVRVAPFGCYVNTTDPTYTNAQVHPCSLTTSGRVRVDLPDNEPINVAQLAGVAVSMGNGAASSGTQRVAIASDSLVPGRTSTAVLANVSSSASNVTLQALNTDRIGWKVVNESTATLFIKFGATASATSYTVQLPPGGQYNMEAPIYTGIIDGIWSAANGNARVTELTQ